MTDHRIKAADSPRWCETCQLWGEHHTDRCPYRVAAQPNLSAADGHDYLENAGYWRDPGKPDQGAGWADLLLFGVIATAAVALCFWLAARPDPEMDCPDGWRKVTSPSAVQCFNPKHDHPRPSVQSSPQPPK